MGLAVAAAVTLIVAAPVRAAAWRDLQRSEPPASVTAALLAAPLVPEPEMPEPEIVFPVTESWPPAEEEASGSAAVQPVAAAEAEAESPDSADADETGPCAEEADDCHQALEKLRSDAISGIDIDIRVGGRAGSDYPCECRLEGETFEPRRFATTTFTWKAAGYCHKPLYFEHWNLERYGHSHGFVADSVLSAAHFFVRIPALPYQLGVELPWECVYPLGYYRPGSCAPWTVPAVPVSYRGLAVGAATATGIVFLLP